MEKSENTAGEVVFAGAGPGDPELLTIAASRAISEADLLLYAGSLVKPDILKLAKEGAELHDSAPLNLEECLELMLSAARAGKKVLRLHAGDPSLFGTLAEQIEALNEAGIAWRIIPGVTAASAAAARAGISFTQPEIAQGLILARENGRTVTPQNEALASLAIHKMPMAIYLSGNLADSLQASLQCALPPDTPILCAHRLGWPGEKLLWTRLDQLSCCVYENSLQRQTVFLVLPAREAGDLKKSRLYDAAFSHGFRPGRK